MMNFTHSNKFSQLNKEQRANVKANLVSSQKEMYAHNEKSEVGRILNRMDAQIDKLEKMNLEETETDVAALVLGFSEKIAKIVKG